MGFREFHKKVFACAACTVCAGAFLATPTAAASAEVGSNASVPQEGLVAYYPFTGGSLENAVTPASGAAGNSNAGSSNAGNSNAGDAATSVPQAAENKGATFGPDRFGNENSAAVFSGDSNCYMEIPDHDAFSIKTAGALTISAWVSPKVLTFRNAEAAGYVHWMGKGVPHQHEWVLRMYNKELTASQENRPNRMSAYAFNLEGGLGSGSYVQEELTAGEWMHIVARYDVESNKITIFKNGVQKDQDPLYDETYGVQVQNGTAPVRLGTRALWSFFEGSIDDVRFYARALADSEIVALYNEPNPAAAKPDTSSKDTSTTVPSDTANVAGDSTKTPGDSTITAIHEFGNSRALGDSRAFENAVANSRTQRTGAKKSQAIIARDFYKNDSYRIQFLVDGKTFDINGRTRDVNSRIMRR